MPDFSWNGIEEIIHGLQSMRAAGYAGPEVGTKHVLVNSEIKVSNDQASVYSMFLLIAPGDQVSILSAGTYTDTYHLDKDGSWKISKRSIRMF